MRIIIGIILVVFGLVWIGSTVAIVLLLGGIMGGVGVAIGEGGEGLLLAGLVSILPLLLFVAIGLVITVIGTALTVSGVRQRKQNQVQAKLIYETGLPVEGTVTFVDRNYSMLVNNAPIYSIVEFKFQDSFGKEYVSRKPNVSSELVIRNQIAVGSTVDIKYLAEDPSQNVLLIADPNTTP